MWGECGVGTKKKKNVCLWTQQERGQKLRKGKGKKSSRAERRVSIEKFCPKTKVPVRKKKKKHIRKRGEGGGPGGGGISKRRGLSKTQESPNEKRGAAE